MMECFVIGCVLGLWIGWSIALLWTVRNIDRALRGENSGEDETD